MLGLIQWSRRAVAIIITAAARVRPEVAQRYIWEPDRAHNVNALKLHAAILAVGPVCCESTPHRHMHAHAAKSNCPLRIGPFANSVLAYEGHQPLTQETCSDQLKLKAVQYAVLPYIISLSLAQLPNRPTATMALNAGTMAVTVEFAQGLKDKDWVRTYAPMTTCQQLWHQA